MALSQRMRGDLWAILSASATGFGFIAAKIALGTLNPLSLNSYVFSIGALVVLVDAIISGKVREMVIVTWRQLGFLFLVAVMFCMATFCLFTALSLVDPATVSFLSRLELVMTLVIAMIFLKERINPPEFIGLILVLLGIVVMRYGASVELSKAVLLVSIGSVIFAAAETTIKWKIDWVNYRSLILYRNIFMGGIYFAVANATGNFIPATDARLLGMLVIAGIFLPYLGRLGYLKAMKNINLSRASIIVQSQPFFAAAAALVVLGTFPSLKELTGGLLIVTGVLVIKIIERRASRRLFLSQRS